MQTTFTRWDQAIAGLVFVALLVVYHANGDSPIVDDAWPTLRVAEGVLSEGAWYLTPRTAPALFRWRLAMSQGTIEVAIPRWNDEAKRLMDQGVLSVAGNHYVLVPTVRPDQFVNTFGIGATCTALPVCAIARALFGSLTDRPALVWRIGKLTASICVAGSAAFIWLIARHYLNRCSAGVLTVAYALGTCVWSVSSQSLWQHGPNELFLAAGTYGLCHASRGHRCVALTAASYAAATWCRPTSALVVLAVAAYFAWVDRRALLIYLGTGLPFGMALMAHNLHFFGKPLGFGQTMLHELAQLKTGSPEIWQTPLWLGAAGELLSPSRGLFVFSPFLILALGGIWFAWRDPHWIALRPLSLAILAIWCVEFRHFDWWSGWSFGYRHLVDSTTMLVLFLMPAWYLLEGRQWLRWVFFASVAWSICVQVLGAVAFDITGWNNRVAFVVSQPGKSPVRVFGQLPKALVPLPPGTKVERVDLDVDLPANRARLWSLADSQLVYYLSHFSEARANRRVWANWATRNCDARESETDLNLGAAWCAEGDFKLARACFERAIQLDPTNVEAVLGLARSCAGLQSPRAAVAPHEYLLATQGDELRVRISLGFLRLAEGQTEAAVREFTCALDGHPMHAMGEYRSQRDRWISEVLPRLSAEAVQQFREVDAQLNGL